MKMPTGIVSTGWPRVERRLSDMAVTFDPWQVGVSKLALAKRADGKYAATIDGITLSIPRQVGKTFLVGSLIIAMCLEFPGLQVVWTAHHLRTSSKTFASMQAMVKRKKVRPHLQVGRNDGIRTANGEQEIAFKNGSKIFFGARAQGFGRGFDEIDVMVFDEAQILTDKALEDMVAATNQARHEHGALLFYMGTPPRPTDPSEAFTNKRRLALKDELHDGVYVECSADDDADLDDPKQWAIANASYPHRTPHESMLRLRRNLPNDDAWRREGLGVWDDFEASAGRPFDLALWDRLKSTETGTPTPAALGIGADLAQTWLSLGAVSVEPRTLGAVHRMRRHQQVEFVAEVARIHAKYEIPVAIDPKGPAGFLVEPLEEAGVNVTRASLDDFVQASADIVLAVATGEIRHADHPELNDAVVAADWRKIGDRQALGRKAGDISMLEAGSLALWAATRELEPAVYFV